MLLKVAKSLVQLQLIPARARRRRRQLACLAEVLLLQVQEVVLAPVRMAGLLGQQVYLLLLLLSRHLVGQLSRFRSVQFHQHLLPVLVQLLLDGLAPAIDLPAGIHKHARVAVPDFPASFALFSCYMQDHRVSITMLLFPFLDSQVGRPPLLQPALAAHLLPQMLGHVFDQEGLKDANMK